MGRDPLAKGHKSHGPLKARRKRTRRKKSQRRQRQILRKFEQKNLPPKPKRKTKPCFFCGLDVLITKITKDHLLPKSRGGGGGANLVGCCQPCNSDKGSLTLEEYRLVIAFRKGMIVGAVMPFPGELAS